MADLNFLATIPIFRFFTRPELEEAEKLFKELVVQKDDVVVKIGDPGDTFFVVLDGELEVWDASIPPRQTGTLRRADYFGEMALLQGGKRTATVKAARRSRLLAVDKPAFDTLFLSNPKAIEYFARVLSQRLAGVTRGDRIRRATTTVSVASRKGLTGETLVAFSLASILKEVTRTEVIYVDLAGAGVEPEPAAPAGRRSRRGAAEDRVGRPASRRGSDDAEDRGPTESGGRAVRRRHVEPGVQAERLVQLHRVRPGLRDARPRGIGRRLLGRVRGDRGRRERRSRHPVAAVDARHAGGQPVQPDDAAGAHQQL
jgi:CRP-like cAMP-binding protein